MTTINLYQNKEQDKARISSRTANGGFWFSIAILGLTIISLFAIRFYIANLVKQNEALAVEVTQQNQGLAGVNSLQRILDMQTRLSEISKNLEIKNNQVGKLRMTQILDGMEKDMNSGVFVSSYSYDGESGIVKITFSARNFNDAARQILNFKKSEFFSDVNLGAISRDDEGINTEVSMKLKNAKNI